jgi:hypothetical protein
MSETFLILRRTERDMIKNIYWSSCTLTVILGGFEFSRQIFGKKKPHIKFQENPSSRSQVVPYGKTEGQTDMTKLIVVFNNYAIALKKVLFTQAKTADIPRYDSW